MLYEEIFRDLNKAKVKYVVAGGVAVVLHGYPRLTQDLDLVVFLEKKNLSKFYDVMTRAGYAPKAPVTKEQFLDAKQRARWQKEKGMIVFSFYHSNPPFPIVDMFINEPMRFGTLYKKRVEVKVEGFIIPVISIEHLKALKKKAGRAKDKDDIIQLSEIQHRLSEIRNEAKRKS